MRQRFLDFPRLWFPLNACTLYNSMYILFNFNLNCSSKFCNWWILGTIESDFGASTWSLVFFVPFRGRVLKSQAPFYIPLNLSFLFAFSSAVLSCMVDGGGMRLLSNLGNLGVNAWTMEMMLESFGSINGNWLGITGITGALALDRKKYITCCTCKSMNSTHKLVIYTIQERIKSTS